MICALKRISYQIKRLCEQCAGHQTSLGWASGDIFIAELLLEAVNLIATTTTRVDFALHESLLDVLRLPLLLSTCSDILHCIMQLHDRIEIGLTSGDVVDDILDSGLLSLLQPLLLILGRNDVAQVRQN